MARSHKPVIWGLFAGGGTLAAFVVPVLILITCFAIPLGLLPADTLSFEHLSGLLLACVSRRMMSVSETTPWLPLSATPSRQQARCSCWPHCLRSDILLFPNPASFAKPAFVAV
jgi:hypothetical protein